MVAGLAERAFEPLGVGAVEPAGWLRRQLRIQADGVTAPLETHWVELADNEWRGGDRDGWERGPYYADGLVPLAWTLDDGDLRARAEAWVEAFLDWREPGGWIGPRNPAFDRFGADPWPRFVVLKVLRQYHEATGDEDALPPENVAPMVVYLMSDEATDVTGCTVRTGGDVIGLVSDPELHRLGYRDGGWRAEEIADVFRDPISQGEDLNKSDRVPWP